MRTSFNVGLPLLIILVGLGYLLANLGIISITPWQAFLMYWPIILIGMGVRIIINAFVKFRFRLFRTNSLILALVLIMIGLHLLLPRLGFDFKVITPGIFWPSLLIVIGIQLLLRSYQKRHLMPSSMSFGDLRRGGDTWFVENLSHNHLIGDVKLDLTKAVIPNKEIFFDIASSIGDIILYLPSDLPVKAHCRIGIGEIRVLDQRTDGLSKSISMQTSDYATADRKLNVHIALRIGEITIRRIS